MRLIRHMCFILVLNKRCKGKKKGRAMDEELDEKRARFSRKTYQNM